MNDITPNKDLLNISLVIDENNTTHIKINPKKNNNVNSICTEVCKKYNLNEKVQDKLGREIKKRIDELMQNKNLPDKTINRLYYESIERNKQKEAFLDEMRKEKERDILNKFSFTPNINKNSNLLYDRKHVKIEDKLYSEFRVIKEKQNYERLITELSERSKADKITNSNSHKKPTNSKTKIRGNSISNNKKINSLNDNTDTNRIKHLNKLNDKGKNNKILDLLANYSKEKILIDNENFNNNNKNNLDNKGNANFFKEFSEKVTSLNIEDLSLINKNRILNTDNSQEDSYFNLKAVPDINNELKKEPEIPKIKKFSDLFFTPKNNLLGKTLGFLKNNIDSLTNDSNRLIPKKRNTLDSNNTNNFLSQLSKRLSFNNPNNERNSYLKRYKTLNAKSHLSSTNAVSKNSMSNFNNNNNLNNFESINLNREKTRSNTINNTVNQFKLNLNTSGSVNKVFDVISEENVNQYLNTMPDAESIKFKDKEIDDNEILNDNKKKFVSSKDLKNLQNNIFNIKLNKNSNNNILNNKEKGILNQEKSLSKKIEKGLESAINLKYKNNILETEKKDSSRMYNGQMSNRNQTSLSSKQIRNNLNIPTTKGKYATNHYLNCYALNLEGKTPLHDKNNKHSDLKENVNTCDSERVNIKDNHITLRLKKENKSTNNLTSRFCDTKGKTKSFIGFDFVNFNDANLNYLNTDENRELNKNYFLKHEGINKNENNNINDSDLTIININDGSYNTHYNHLNNNISNDPSKTLCKYKANIKEEQAKIQFEKSKSINKKKMTDNELTKKVIKKSIINTPAKSFEISKFKLKQLIKQDRGDKDIFTHLYDTRNDSKKFRENYSKQIFSKIYTFKPTILDTNFLDKNRKNLDLDYKKEENKEQFYRRLSDSKRINHIFSKRQSKNISYKSVVSAERSSKRINFENNPNTDRITTINTNSQEKISVKNKTDVEKYNPNYFSAKKKSNKPNSNNYTMDKKTNYLTLDTYSSLSSRLNPENKNIVALTDRNESNKSIIFKKILKKSKSKITKDIPITQSMSYYEKNLINSGKKLKPFFLKSSSKTIEKTHSLQNEDVKMKLIFPNKSDKFNFNFSKEKFDSDFECKNCKYDLPLQKSKINSADETNDNYEAKIINISVNEIIVNENNSNNVADIENDGINNDANINYLATVNSHTRNHTNIKEIGDTDFPYCNGDNYFFSTESNGNEGKNNMNLENFQCSVSKEKNQISLNGGSYEDLRKIKSYDIYNKNNNNDNTLILHKTLSITDLIKNKKENYSSIPKNNRQISNRSHKEKFETKIKNANMKIREIKQKEDLNNLAYELNENKVKQESFMLKKHQQNLKKIKMDKLHEIYQISIRNLDDIDKLKDFGISNFIIENLVIPFLTRVYNQELSLNFDDFSLYANQTLDAFSNGIQ